MFIEGNGRKVLLLAGAALILLLSACTSADAPPSSPQLVEVTRLVPQTVVVTQLVEQVITTTPAPEAMSATPTPAGAASASGGALAVLPDGFSAWCMPEGSTMAVSVDAAGSIPPAARPAELVDGVPELIVRAQSCTFVFRFNQPVPAGSELLIYGKESKPWLKAALSPAGDNPTVVYATLNHRYIIDPPFWIIDYRFSIQTPDGLEAWSGPVKFRRGWQPELCWNGEWPDPGTLLCPPNPNSDIHPWNEGYAPVLSPTPE